jgi:hypothetical protein
VPALFALASFAIVIDQIVRNPGASLTGLALVAAGLPVYAVWARATRPAG